MSDNLGTQVMGPAIELAARVKAVLESLDHAPLSIDTEYEAHYYVGTIEIRATGPGWSEVVGYLVPDEADGNTFDYWTAENHDL